MIYTFSEEEIRKCLWWSDLMEKKKGHWKSTNRWRPNTGRTHFQSKKAEVASAWYLRDYGAEVDWTIRRGDGHIDHTLDTGHTADTKYAGQRWYAFKTNGSEKSEFVADIGILVSFVGEESLDCAHEIMGIISRQKFLRECQIDDYGYGPRWAVEQPLASPNTLLEWLAKQPKVTT